MVSLQCLMFSLSVIYWNSFQPAHGLNNVPTAYQNENGYFTVSIQRAGSHYCTGVLISTQHVLSTGQCIYIIDTLKIKAAFTVVTGSNIMMYDTNIYEIDHVVYHGGYKNKSPSGAQNDIAIIKLGKLIQGKGHEAIANLAKKVMIKKDCHLIGWSKKRLVTLPVKLVSKNDCLVLMDEFKLPQNIICSIEHYEVVIKGDQGIPLVCGGLVTGLLSWKRPEFDSVVPVVYTSIPAHYDFIKSNINKDISSWK